MKKTLFSLLSLVLVLCMALTFTACKEEASDEKSEKETNAEKTEQNTDEDENKTPEELIVGTWEAKINIADQLLEMFEMEDLKNIKLNYYLQVKFTSNGDVELKYDGDATVKEFENFKTILIDALYDKHKEEVADQDATYEEFKSEGERVLDNSFDGLKESLSYHINATYEIDGDKIIISLDENDVEKIISFKISKNELVWVTFDGFPDEYLPLTFERLK